MKLKEKLQGMMFTEEMDEIDKSLLTGALIFDVACGVGTAMLIKNAANTICPNRSKIENIGLFGLQVGAIGMANFNLYGAVRKSVMERIEEVKNGTDTTTDGEIIDAADAFAD